MSEMKRVSILGVTGSIGQTTTKLLLEAPDHFQTAAITAHDNVLGLIEAAKKLRPTLAVIGNPDHYTALKETLAPLGIVTAAGEEALLQAAQEPCDITIAGIVGAAGLRPTLASLAKGRRLLLANKECLVCAGSYFMKAVHDVGAELLPIDSEHNGLFQLLQGVNTSDVEHLTITASGGPFLGRAYHELADITPAQAANHPNWKMGAKISVDSATLVNKGLELIEAFHLFPAFTPAQFQVVIHPQSVVHSMVHLRDGSVLMQASTPNMAVPIAHGLAYPARLATNTPRLSLVELGGLNFASADQQPALTIARAAYAAGDAATLAFNASNEVAVHAFLRGEIRFTQIIPVIEQTMEKSYACAPALTSLDAILAHDAQMRAITTNALRKI